jgi:hypothetical protein
LLDETDDAGTAEGGADTDDDEALLRKLKRWERQARQHWSTWREEARQAYDFVSGKQWSADDKALLLDQMRQPVTFNRIAPMVDAVTGAEILNRQEVRYSPREQGDVQVNELITAADEWARNLADTEDEESDAFADVVICGMAWTETRMDYAEDPEGRILDDRVDPLEMLADPQAKKRCLADARYFIRSRWRNKTDLKSAWRAKIKDASGLGGAGSTEDDIGMGHTGPRDDYEREDANPVEPTNKNQVWIRHYQWFDKVEMYRIADEATGQAIVVDKTKLKEIAKMLLEHGIKPPEHVKIEQNKYKQAIVAGDVILEQGDIECGAFTFKCITGKRDRNANTFYGVVRAMVDPQMWGNKFFVQIMHILNTAAKGGLMYEAGSFANPRKALEDWAKPDAAIELQRGALSGQKASVQERQPAIFPVGLDKMMEFALNNLPQTSGINLEMLGLVERDQPGVLEAQRKKAGYAILAVFFDSLRRYRKMKGRVRLFFIQHYISDGRLIKIKGKDNTEQYVPLVKQSDTATYDVIVDDAPMSPNQKEMTWQMMSQMMPMLAKLNVPPEVWAIMLEYSPLPSGVSQKINQVIMQAAQEPPPPDPDIVKAQTQAQSKQLELQQKAEAQQQQAALDQQKAEREFQLEQAKMANELEVEKTKLAIEVEKSRQELAAMQEKHNMEMVHEQHKMAMTHEEHQQSLAFEDERSRRELAFQDRQQTNDLAFQDRKSQRDAASKTEQAKIAASAKPAPAEQPKQRRRVSIKRDPSGRMSEIVEH